ncbi:hypothetical protein ACJIZ3_003762 [Penstemon smallii]|uniref:Uncharacterized protein n=1 Tax=Penstemon smallii TaxID=265156 RepID=A0ABD3S075_9LAMI
MNESIYDEMRFITKMGNCLFGGTGDAVDQSTIIKVTTSNGGVMEFNSPITVESITDEFPCHGIFRSQDLFWKPLPHSQVLLAGESYHLLDINNNIRSSSSDSDGLKAARVGHVRSNSAPPQQQLPYRMSFDNRGLTKKKINDDDDVSPYGFWKVKLVISPKQLLEILSEEGKTEELLESVRTVGRCGTTNLLGGGFSDQWSF